MGRFDVKNEEKAPSDANKRGKRFGGRKNVWREDFAVRSEALSALQVKLDCGEGNAGRRFLECIRHTRAQSSKAAATPKRRLGTRIMVMALEQLERFSVGAVGRDHIKRDC